MKSLSTYFKIWKRDYRHFVCIFITLISIGMGFLFPNALPRFGEAIRDFFTSVAYYFCNFLYRNKNPIRATVTQMPSWQFSEQIWKPIEIFPYTWEEFKILWSKYWEVLFTKENFLAYWYYLDDIVYYISLVIMALFPLFVTICFLLNSQKNKHCTDRWKKSKPLKCFEKILFRVIYPVTAWFKNFIWFCKENKIYYQSWLILWCLHFNIFALGVEFFSYLIYFSMSWDLKNLYTQILKLLYDLTPLIRFLPNFVWFIIGIKVYNYICTSMAFTRLYYFEKCNRSFLKDRGIVSTVYGNMGVGKTQMITSMAISAEIEQFDMAFDIILEIDRKFPNFPWQKFRDELKKQIDNRNIVDVVSCRRWVQHCRYFFDRIYSLSYTSEEYQQIRKQKKLLKFDYTFGYDYTHYKILYNDELKITHLYDCLEDYACAYLVFTVKTTLLFSNYSIRVDSIIKDLGNMLERDNDFLNRDPALQDSYSRHAHIIDIDMLRLGKKMIKDNPKARRVSFGIYVVTEIDKEFKNMNELKEMKINEKEANQKNDLHNACIMMIRHACVISNRVFVRIIADLQRPEAWGAGGRELGEVIFIEEKGDLAPALPFLSPYWLCQGLFIFFKSLWDKFKNKYDVMRSDKTLYTYLMHNICSKIQNHYDKVNGLLGTQTLKLEIQSGRMDGEVKKDKWRIITKKDRSRRYKTSCLEAVFESYKPNTMHIDDFIMYAGEVGTEAENELQNSYFQNDIKKMKELNAS